MKSQVKQKKIIEGFNEFQLFKTRLRTILNETEHKDRLLRGRIEALLDKI